MLTVVALLLLSGVAGALVFWSMSWESAWPGPHGSGGALEGKRHRRDPAAASAAVSFDGVPAAVAIMEHGEPDAPPSILGRLWAMLRLVLVVAVACGIVAGAIYFVASSISKAFGHGGG